MPLRAWSCWSLLAVAVCVAAPFAIAQQPEPKDEDASKAPDWFATMEWRCIGPARGGRAQAVAGVPGDPNAFYMGATGGGVWKTTDAGVTWRNVTDKFVKTGSVGAIAVAPSDPNIVYVGMGEVDIRGNFSHGDGMYRSLDAGKTWTHIGLDDSRQIGRIRVHPRDPNLVYAAALGHVFGPNQERGVFRSRDGGATWDKVKFIDENTGAVDIAMDMTNPRVLYAAFWQARRTPWTLDSGGPGSGIYKTSDGGDTWTLLEKGLPKGVKGKIGVAVSSVDPNRVWAMVEAEDGGVYRSDDAGENWRKVNEERSLRQRAWYYTRIYADTKDVDTVYVVNVGFHKSTDGGRTFRTIRVPHGDNHDLWIAPEDNQRLINSNDGGANVTFNGGQTWSTQANQPTAQFYHVITDDQFPYRVYGAQQDNSTASVSSRGTEFGNWQRDLYDVGGGESGYIAVKPGDPDIVYAGSYGGYLTRYDHETGISRNIMVWPENPMGWGAAELNYRFQWTFPIVISPHDPNRVYAGGNVLFASDDEGLNWKPISGDLTTNDKSKQQASGGPITKDNTSVEYYCTIFTIAESPKQRGLIWVGSDDGLIHVTADNGQTWSDVTPKGMGDWPMISLIEASPHTGDKAYAAVNRYKMDDFAPRIYRTTDRGRTWTPIAKGIDPHAFVRAVREDPVREGLLYAGTETGVWVSFDDGANWRSLQGKLPVVPITDLVVKDEDLVVATQGRSFWILDDLAPLRAYQPEKEFEAVALLEPGPTFRQGWDSVRLHYFLKAEPTEELKIEVLDSKGAVIKTFSDKPAKKDEAGAETKPAAGETQPAAAAAEEDEESEEGPPGGRRGGGDPKPTLKKGMNVFSWNMRYPDAAEVPGAVMWAGNIRGPMAPPGKYQARLTMGETTLTAPFEIKPHPNMTTTDVQYQEQFETLMAIRDTLDATHKGVNAIRSVRKQVEAAIEHSSKSDGAKEIAEAGKALNEKLKPIEEKLIQTRSKSSQDPLNYPIMLNNKIAAIAGAVDEDFPVTPQVRAVLEEMKSEIDGPLTALQTILESDVPAFNELVRSKQVPAVIVDKK